MVRQQLTFSSLLGRPDEIDFVTLTGPNSSFSRINFDMGMGAHEILMGTLAMQLDNEGEYPFLDEVVDFVYDIVKTFLDEKIAKRLIFNTIHQLQQKGFLEIIGDENENPNNFQIGMHENGIKKLDRLIVTH